MLTKFIFRATLTTHITCMYAWHTFICFRKIEVLACCHWKGHVCLDVASLRLLYAIVHLSFFFCRRESVAEVGRSQTKEPPRALIVVLLS
ncbi:hypothetical protein HanIR_Chr15g0769381 [Helianthus annuus]|nr:hypothetical protein HanIR_Chr15g0769381 [Helianthus annuus]